MSEAEVEQIRLKARKIALEKELADSVACALDLDARVKVQSAKAEATAQKLVEELEQILKEKAVQDVTDKLETVG